MIRNEKIFFEKVRNIPLDRKFVKKKGEFITTFAKVLVKKFYNEDENLQDLMDNGNYLVNENGEKYFVQAGYENKVKPVEEAIDYLVFVKFDDKYEVELMAEFPFDVVKDYKQGFEIDKDIMKKANVIRIKDSFIL